MSKEHVTVELDTVKQIGFEGLSEDVNKTKPRLPEVNEGTWRI